MASEEKVKRIHRLAPCPSYDVERLESWLTDMAKDGWHLEEDSFLGFLPFVQGAPRNVRYRLEPKPKNNSDSIKPDAEARELAAEYGWEFVNYYDNFYIYRATHPDAREMNTDLAVQSMALKSVRHNFTLHLAFQTILIGDMLVRIFKEPFRHVATFGAIYPVAVLLFIAAIIYDIRRATHIRKLRKQLKGNIPLDHNKPWKKSAPLHRWSRFALIALYVFVLTMAFSRCSAALASEGTPTSDYPGDPPIVTIQDISPAGNFTEENFLDYNSYSLLSTAASPTILEWRELGRLVTPKGDIISGSIFVSYYETAAPWLAEGLFNDYLRNARKDEHYIEKPLPRLDADEAAAYYLYGNTILIRHGNVFIEAHINLHDQNDKSLMEAWAIMMADMLT